MESEKTMTVNEKYRLPSVEYREMICPRCKAEIILPILQYDPDIHSLVEQLGELAKKRNVLETEIKAIENTLRKVP
jgi:hypothetical protein